MTQRRTVGPGERRARLGARHLFAPGTQASSVADAASAMVVLHASDSASVFMQAGARTTRSSPADLEREMYEDRTVLRMLAMRRTLFLAPDRMVQGPGRQYPVSPSTGLNSPPGAPGPAFRYADVIPVVPKTIQNGPQHRTWE